MSNTPTDAEIDEVTLDVLGYAALDKETNETARMIARAVLAKWGTPTPVGVGAVPQGWKAVPVNPTPEMWKAAKTVPDPNPPYPRLVWDAMLAASPTPPAEQQATQVIIDFPQVGTAGPFPVVDGRVSLPDSTMQDLVRMLRPTYEAEQQAAPKAAPGVGNSGFDHKTAADFLNGKTVSDEAVRTFVAASRWAHDERAALSATLLAMHGVLTSREAEIALLKKALLEAEAAPQQEAQKPVAWLNPWRADQVTTDYDAYGEHGIPLYTAPQPAPAPLSESEYKRGYRDGYERRDAEVRGALV